MKPERTNKVKLLTECGRRRRTSGGFVMIAVLIVALIGFMFGLGRLMSFRYQCERRLDRQDELNRIMATRSAIQYLYVNKVNQLPPKETNFVYRAQNLRNTIVTLSPALPVDIFLFNAPIRLIEQIPGAVQNCTIFGKGSPVSYPHGAITNLTGGIEILWDVNTENNYLKVNWNNMVGTSAVFGVEWDGAGTIEQDVSWANDPYGRRYSVWPKGKGVGDVVRMVLAVKQPGSTMSVFDMNSSPAIALNEIITSTNSVEVEVKCRYSPTNSWMVVRPQGPFIDAACQSTPNQLNSPDQTERGIQIAGTTLTLCGWHSGDGTEFDLTQYELPAWTTNEFKNGLRIYCEVVRADTNSMTQYQFHELRVERSFDYYCRLQWNSRIDNKVMSEVSTVIRVAPPRQVGALKTYSKTYTYDTHGTAAR